MESRSRLQSATSPVRFRYAVKKAIVGRWGGPLSRQDKRLQRAEISGAMWPKPPSMSCYEVSPRLREDAKSEYSTTGDSFAELVFSLILRGLTCVSGVHLCSKVQDALGFLQRRSSDPSNCGKTFSHSEMVSCSISGPFRNSRNQVVCSQMSSFLSSCGTRLSMSPPFTALHVDQQDMHIPLCFLGSPSVASATGLQLLVFK